MSSSDVKITITAIDNASAKFDDVANSADKLGPSLDAASTSATSLGPAIDGVNTSLTDTSTTLTDNDIPGAFEGITSAIGEFVTGSTEFEGAGSKIGGALEKIASVGLDAVTSLGPLGLVAAAGAATVAAYNYVKSLGSSGGISEATQAAIDRTHELNTEVAELAGSLDDAAQGYALFAQSSDLSQSVADLNELVDLGGKFAKEQGWSAFGDSIDDYNEAIARTNELSAKYGITFDNLHVDMDAANSALADVTQAQELYNEVLDKGGPGADLARNRLAELVQGLNDGSLAIGGDGGFVWQLQWMVDNYDAAYNQTALNEAALKQYAETAYNAAVSVGLLNDTIEQFVAAGIKTPAALTALQLTQSALKSTFDVVVGGSNALGQAAQEVADWSASLFEVDDSQTSKLSRWFADNTDKVDVYNDALDANNRIQVANAAIQEDIIGIQANQAPLLADLIEKQRAYIDSLKDLPAEQQLVSLGYLDAAESAKAMELAQLAAQASSGALGDTGEETATKIIAAAAQADPVMKAMLEDMGLISEGADGTITVNFPTAEDITSHVDALKASIDALTVALGGIPPDVTTNINANDNASGTIDSVRSQINSLDGTSATVTVNYISNTVGGAPAGSNIGGNRNGGIIGYANGGMVMAKLAEDGAELLHFANGGDAVVPNPGIYAVDIGTSVTPAHATRSILRDAARASGGGGESHNYFGPVTQTVTLDQSSFARRSANLASWRR